MIRPKGLGRGLDALLAGVDEPAPSGETLRMIGFAEVACRAPGKGPKTKKRNCGVSLQVLLLPLHGLVSGSNDVARFRSTKFPVTPLPASCEALRLNVSPITGALLTGSSAATWTNPVLNPERIPHT